MGKARPGPSYANKACNTNKKIFFGKESALNISNSFTVALCR